LKDPDTKDKLFDESTKHLTSAANRFNLPHSFNTSDPFIDFFKQSMAKINMFAAINSNFKESIDLTMDRKSQDSLLTKRKRGRPPKSFVAKEKRLNKIRPFEDEGNLMAQNKIL
jgi:hypothetical protein